MHHYLKIIFLDIDGVLNCQTTTDKCNVYRGIEDAKILLLKSIVDNTNAKIALISSWKENYYLKLENKIRQDELANYLDSKLNKFNLKITYVVPDYPCSLTRADMVSNFLFDFSLKGYEEDEIKYVILDDKNNGYIKNKALKNHFIKTDFNNGGLLPLHTIKAIEILNCK